MSDRKLSVKIQSAGYGRKEIIRCIGFESRAGELTGIIGPNGSGKTTLLKAACGLLSAEGEVIWDGKNLLQMNERERARTMGYIPQRSGITISVSVLDTVLMGFNPELRIFENPDGEMIRKAFEALSAVGLRDLAEADFQKLSEGQKQLCILARTIAAGREILFLDEPESALDFSGRYRMAGLLMEAVKKTGGTAVLTLHDPQLAVNICDRLVMVKDGKTAGCILPGTDPLPVLEEKLCSLYGPLSVHRIADRGGKERTVILREETNG